MNQASLRTLLKTLRIKRSKFPKIRVGANGDGGYVISNDLDGIDGVISLGTGPDVSFDLFFAERGIPVYQYDPTVAGPPQNHERFVFNKIGWGAKDEGPYLSLASILERHHIADSTNLILKFDVEGAEWLALAAIDPALLKKFRIITGEFHNFQWAGEPEVFPVFDGIFKKLNARHTVVHAHANNWRGVVEVHGIAMPEVVEFTWLRNDRSTFEASNELLPTRLDYPNNPAAPDIVLTLFGGRLRDAGEHRGQAAGAVSAGEQVMTDPAAIKKAQFEGTYTALVHFWGNKMALNRRMDMMVERYWMDKRAASSNPLVKAGQKYSSQNDEDGITLEICRRIGKLESGIFVEFGVGDGLENGTLILLMNGWKGVWIGGEELKIAVPPANTKLKFLRNWITADNCVELMTSGLSALGSPEVDYLSVDLDGNDFYVAEALLNSGVRPSLIVVEYNSKFPPPIRWMIAYDPQHNWGGNDYHGASLQSFIDLFEASGYRLVGCNLTGSNAFFVDRKFDHAFSDVPTDPATLFHPADYNWFLGRGHATSPRTIERFLERD